MKTVAIVGAGPCGIVAAQKFLQSSNLAVTIFERNAGFGGLWRPGGLINPEMRTNQTKFTVAFSDLSWETVDCGQKDTPIHPKAWQVYRYLSHYVKKYIPDEMFRFNTEVTNIARIFDKNEGGQLCRWSVTTKPTRDAADDFETEHTFDYLVIAPGAFSVPRKVSLRTDHIEIPVLHSTSYRFLSDILNKDDPSLGIRKNVVVVGGSHSGTEVASLLALQLSDAQNSAHYNSLNYHSAKNISIIHVTSHELFALPVVLRDSSSKTCAYQPADFKIFNRSNRPVEPPPSFRYGLWNEEKSKAAREMCESILSGGNDVSEQENVQGRPPIGVMGELYPQLVINGSIAPLIGHLRTLKKGKAENLATAIIQKFDGKNTECYIENVIAVIDATGFDTISPLSILPDDVKSQFGFDENCPRMPLHITSSYLCQNPALPTLAVLGFNGAHWGTFEMQARAISQHWSEESFEHSESQKTEASKIAEYIESLRVATRNSRPEEIPQNPVGDYVGLLEQASRELRLDRLNIGCTSTSGVICSARYIDPGSDRDEAMITMSDLEQVQIKAKESGLFIARAAFHGLLGEWISAQRGEDDKIQTIQLSFHPRLPTDSNYGWEYLVVETRQPGEHETRLIYRYDESLDDMTIWSVDPRDGMTPGIGLYRLDFSRINRHGKDTAVASRISLDESHETQTGSDVDFRFLFKGASLENFKIETTTCGAKTASQHFVRLTCR